MARYFCFRFDVDTHRCIRRGVPNLLELSARIDARFTFFVHMGRAISRRRTLRRLLSGPRRGRDEAAKLPARVKLGLRDLFVAAVRNPPVGAGSPRILADTLAGGHEIGLHGGVNHAVWQAEADSWAPSRLRQEVGWALGRLESITGRRPRGFASPGWTTSGHLPALLEELGFEYLADAHGPQHPAIMKVPESRRLIAARTGFSGEPGGVAYLEHLRARGLGDAAIKEDFRDRLQVAGRLAVVYDHPYYAGVRELDLIGDLIATARGAGFQVVTLAEAVAALRAGR